MGTESEIRAAYVLWLKGVPLRSIQRLYGLRNHNIVVSKFKKVFGDDATNVVKQSLWRSILEDYEDNKEVEDWVVDQVAKGGTLDQPESKFRSKHSLKQLSEYQVVRKPELLDTIAFTTDPLDDLAEQEDGLRLPLFIWALSLNLRLISLSLTWFKDSSVDLAG